MRRWWIYFLMIPVSVSFADEDIIEQATETEFVLNGLTLEQSIQYVLRYSPAIKSASYELKAVAARVHTAQLGTPYRATIEMQNFAGSGANKSADALESTLSLSKVLEWGNKAKLRGEIAHERASILKQEQDAQLLDLLAETAKRFIHVVTDQERLNIAKDSLAFSEYTLKLVEKRVKAARSANVELRRAKIALAKKQLELEHAEHELLASWIKLTTLWGQTGLQEKYAHADLFLIKPAGPFESLVKLLDKNPDLIRYATQQRLANARMQLAKSKQRPDIGVSGGIRHFNSSDDTAFVFSLNVPLGTSSRASSLVDEARLLKQSEPYQYKQKKLDLTATLFQVYQELKHAIEATKILRNTVIPEAKQALVEYEKGYRAGRYSYFELTEAQRTVLEARLDAVMAASSYHRLYTEINRLTGADLEQPEPKE